MTDSERSDSEVYELIDKGLRLRERVDLAPAQRCIDVIPCCGPQATLVMVDTYADRGALFITPDEAEQLAAVLIRKAAETRRLNVG